MAVRLLSLVIPAYKQEKIIIRNVKSLSKALSELPLDYEIIVVVDGYKDRTYDKVVKMKSDRLSVIGYEKNQGKGFAVKTGMLKAKGDVIGFMDAGMDISSSAISILLDHMELHMADVIVGSKLHPDSIVNFPHYRKIFSWGYRSLTQFLFNFDVKDTQVGLKLFRRKVAKDVFSKIVVKKFAFDVEVLAVAYALGYHKIYEAPIKLRFRNSGITNKNFWIIIFWMLWDTLAIFYRLRVIRYYDKK